MSQQRVSLSFCDIEYSVKIDKGETKPILRGVSGLVNPGEMLVILGPSGSGKTSLIQIVGKKIKSDNVKTVTGRVLCNDQELTATDMMRISGFVSQEDVFNAELTVLETLRFAARLRLSSNQREARVNEVVKMLQLENCIKTYIGDDSNPYLKGISGGEKRRLAIALEILDPHISVLILDEPTSGLDAAAALNVANVLRSLADSGITVATTLHQPRTSIMDQFHHVMVLAGGRRVFLGPLQDYVPFMESELRVSVPQHESPYDLMLDLLNPAIQQHCVQVGITVAEDKPLMESLADAFDQSELKRRVDSAESVHNGGIERSKSMTGKASIGWFSKFVTILYRTFLIKMRDPMVLMTQIATAVFLGIIFGILYWDTYNKDKIEFKILDTQMCITMVTVMALWIPFDVTLTFPKERKVFLRERKAGLYPTTAFFFARILADMPMHIVAGALLGAIIYPMAQLKMGILNMIIICVIGALVGASVMQTIGAVSRTFEEANLLMMPVMMVAMMTSTTFVRQVPGWLSPLRDISMMGLLADMAMYWEFREFGDSEWGTPDDILSDFGVLIRNDDDVWQAFLILVGILCASRLMTFLAVKFLHTGRSSCKENLAD